MLCFPPSVIPIAGGPFGGCERFTEAVVEDSGSVLVVKERIFQSEIGDGCEGRKGGAVAEASVDTLGWKRADKRC